MWFQGGLEDILALATRQLQLRWQRTARQERSERNIGDHSQANRFAQARDQLFLDLVPADGRAVKKPQVPVGGAVPAAARRVGP